MPVVPLRSWDTKTGDCLELEGQIAAWNKKSRFKQGWAQGLMVHSWLSSVLHIHTVAYIYSHMHTCIHTCVCFVIYALFSIVVKRNVVHRDRHSLSLLEPHGLKHSLNPMSFFLIHSVENYSTCGSKV